MTTQAFTDTLHYVQSMKVTLLTDEFFKYHIENGNDTDCIEFYGLLRTVHAITNQRPVTMDGRIAPAVEHLLNRIDAYVRCQNDDVPLEVSFQDPDYPVVKGAWIDAQTNGIREAAGWLLP